MQKMYAYIRVSTLDQNDIRQRLEMERYGISAECIFCDKISGTNFNRPQYQKLKKQLREADVLVLKSLDRLGRNYEEVKEEWRELTKGMGVDMVVLDMPILDTRVNRDLVGTLITDIVLQLLSYVAQVERDNIHQRQAEGIAAAKLMGKHLGRPRKPYPDGFFEVYIQYKNREITAKMSAEILGITLSEFQSFLVRCKRDEMTSTLVQYK